MKLLQPGRAWFQDVMQLYGLQDLSRVAYTCINHGLFSSLVKVYHSETSSFHLLISVMSITLDDMSSFLHLMIRERFLNHSKLTRSNTLDMMV